MMRRLCLAVGFALIPFCSLADGWSAQSIATALDDYRQGDFTRAVEIFKALANHGDTVSQYYLGLMYANGQGIEKDEAQAVQWYEKSARQGYAKAQNNLGEMYYHGRGVARDYEQARSWYRKAAGQGLAIAQRNLGESYRSLDPIDYGKAEFWLRKAASQGKDADQLALAVFLYRERGYQNGAEAAPWMLKAARKGIAAAQSNMGVFYEFGQGVPKNYAKALYWYHQAASQGDSYAYHLIGDMYRKGKGVAKDFSQATQWYCDAAKRGYDQAVIELFYAGTLGVDCLTDIAKQGNETAQYLVGSSYENQGGGNHDYPNAVNWYRKSAAQGNTRALSHLGDLYALGIGVPQDVVLAQTFYNLGRYKSYGTEHSSRIGQPLSDRQKLEAEKLTNAWKKGTPLPETSETGQVSGSR